ncbi:hypothetical protein IFM89_003820 [Coptis chinensis]|uniref:Uncharacterized protein n=1 Tax=Coptis chinensis TaxID=261450 RepID=A0A835HI83_9MAGN|nr:hypothetical protein IFM89_003820 [Coptis chinensis]
MYPSKFLRLYFASTAKARLTETQVSKLRNVPGILQVVPETVSHLHTTRTPDFLQLSQSFGLWPKSDYGNDMIIGVLDSGIWPESESFKMMAGSVVKNAGFYGLARGDARGMATKARLAIYKVCWEYGSKISCSDADILAALEDAISDGVNVISMSIGTFAAVKKGITVSCSAGNDGPRESTVENLAPWILTVGASSIDRDFRADAILGDGPGGPADPHLLPATMVDPMAGNIIRSYANQSSAKARIIFKGTVIGGNPLIPAPQVAQFSSRGSNRVTPGILKPDFMAPGVNILASWTGVNSPSGLSFDTRRQVKFNIKYGTSMACPHVSGLAALLHKVYPNWSPAAIKSALMTTAYNVDNTGNGIRDLATGNPSTPFDHGSGHVDPNRALDPGLVYDLGVNDYIGFLCSIGYNERQIEQIVQDQTVDCSTMGLASPGDLNYPSFSIVFKASNNKITIKRVLKNVGQSENVVYDVKVSSPSFIETTVLPSKLVFSPENHSLSYEVTFSALVDLKEGTFPQFGWIEWTDGHHNVRSPIAFARGMDLLSSI